MTLVELLVVVGMIAILAGIAIINYEAAQTRAKVAAVKNNLRVLGGAIEIYRVDQGGYPLPRPTFPDDPLGVLATSTLPCLTTPVAYVSASAFRDPFGALRSQEGASGFILAGDPFRPPEPGFNEDQSLITIHYPDFARLVAKPAMNKNGFNIISIGPDLQDSLITYFPFPQSLPGSAVKYGIREAIDSVYDPTNGTTSAGDIAWFGGELVTRQLVGGGF